MGGGSIMPSNEFILKALFPSLPSIVNFTIQNGWKFMCLPFPSWGLSQFRTRSPTSKLFFPTTFLSNWPFTWFWCITNLYLDLSPSSLILSKLCILLWTSRQVFPYDSWERCEAKRYRFGGKIASLLYTRKYGEVFKEGLGVTRYIQSALVKEES